jgi:hypothetical protein
MPNKTLTPQDVAIQLCKIPPGGYYDVYGDEFQEISEFIPWADRTFADIVLSNVMGSAYEWFYQKSQSGYRFWRLLRPYPSDCGILSFVEPDRLECYEGVPGRYVRKDRKSVWYSQENVPIDERIYYSIEALEKDFYRGIRPYSIIEVPVFTEAPVRFRAFNARPAPNETFSSIQYTVRECWHGQRFQEIYFYKLVQS